MKVILLLAINFLLTCAGNETLSTTSRTNSTDLIRITAIDTVSLDYGIIIDATLAGELVKIVTSKSRSLTEDCKEKISIGFSYRLSLDRIKSTKQYDAVTFRFDGKDIYTDGELVFPGNVRVYESNQLDGLCISSAQR